MWLKMIYGYEYAPGAEHKIVEEEITNIIDNFMRLF